MTRQMLGREILQRLIKDIADKAVVENMPRQEGNTLHLILAPPKFRSSRNGAAVSFALPRKPLSATCFAGFPTGPVCPERLFSC